MSSVFAALRLALCAASVPARTAPRPLRHGGEDLEEAYVIGDLHADLHCAREWVRQSGLVDLESWVWTGSPQSTLVFLGDYVDKGPEGRQVLEFVRNLTDTFPDRVLAMLGNHDFYLFLDASLGSMGASHVMGSPVRDFAYAFTHPEEYLNWMPDHVRSDNETAAALGALFQALAWVYGRRGEAQVMLTPTPGKLDLFEAAPPFREDPGLAERTRARLREWQGYMSSGLASTGLLSWLAERPVAAQVGGALIVHGGLPPALLREVLRRPGARPPGEELAAALQGVLRHPERVRHGDLVDEAVTYRGYHEKYSGPRACGEVDDVLALLAADTAAELIVVGHTPGDHVRTTCRGRLVAADSSLSRFFRAHGNLYCPVRINAGPIPSAAGCAGEPPAAARCEGQALRLRREPAEPAEGAPAPARQWRVQKVPADGRPPPAVAASALAAVGWPPGAALALALALALAAAARALRGRSAASPAAAARPEKAE